MILEIRFLCTTVLLAMLFFYLTSRFSPQSLVLALIELRILIIIARCAVHGLLLGLAWLEDRLTRRRALFGGYQSIRSTNDTTSVDTPQDSNSTGGNQPGMNGIPSDWVRIKLCKTDEISELLLNNDTAMTLNVMQSGDMGVWEEREQFMITKKEIERRVSAWLERLEE